MSINNQPVPSFYYKPKDKTEQLLKKTLLKEKCNSIEYIMWTAYDEKEEDYKHQFVIKRFTVNPTKNKEDILYVQYNKCILSEPELKWFEISFAEKSERPVFLYFCKNNNRDKKTIKTSNKGVSP